MRSDLSCEDFIPIRGDSGFCSSINKHVDRNSAPCKTCRSVVEAVFLTKARLKVYLEIVVGEPIPVLRDFKSLAPFSHFEGIVPSTIDAATEDLISFVDLQGHHYKISSKEVWRDGTNLEISSVFARIALSKSRRPRELVDLERNVSDWVLIDLGLKKPPEIRKKRKPKPIPSAKPASLVASAVPSISAEHSKPVATLQTKPIKKKEPKKNTKSLFDF